MPRLLSKDELDATLLRLAHDIAVAAPGDGALAIIGIRRRGETLARRLLPLLERAGRPVADYGALDITLYRDDLTTIGPAAMLRGTEIDFDVTGKWVVLVDDVLYTGRSVRAALDAIIDLGRPRVIKLAVLIDRGWRELPIQPDFVGRHVDTRPENIVKVKLVEVDEVDEVELV
jgi:pyrimidine operon attenuation protein/uracil phosphoribosyltransferase